MRANDLWELLVVRTDDCVIWPHAQTTAGYGMVRKMYTHVLACTIANGPRPAGMEAAHACGNPSCVNRRHLRWATPAENQADKLAHGTSNRGAAHGMSKLDRDQVVAIRALRAAGRPLKEIALIFGVSRQTVGDVTNGRSWAWLK